MIMHYISDLFLKNPFLILDNITSKLKASEVPSFSPIFDAGLFPYPMKTENHQLSS